MSQLAGLTEDEDIVKDRDSVGGFTAWESAVYLATVKLAFLTRSKNDALALNVHFDGPNKTSLRAQFWMASGTAKGGKNFYINQKGEKHYLPGFNRANALCLLTGSGPIATQKTAMKTIPLYDSVAKGEVPTEVEMLMDLLGKQILIGVLNQKVDKTVLDAATGKYVPTGEFKVENEIDKIFRVKDKLTVLEVNAQATEPAFIKKWVDAWKGKTKDKTSKDVATPGAPKRESGAQAPQTSLFTD